MGKSSTPGVPEALSSYHFAVINQIEKFCLTLKRWQRTIYFIVQIQYAEVNPIMHLLTEKQNILALDYDEI